MRWIEAVVVLINECLREFAVPSLVCSGVHGMNCFDASLSLDFSRNLAPCSTPRSQRLNSVVEWMLRGGLA